MDYEVIKENLRRQIGPLDIYTKKDETGADRTLTIGANLWHGTENVLGIELRLEGVSPLEGNVFNDTIGKISAGSGPVSIPINRLHGDYVVHFDAVTTDMHKIMDALQPIPMTFLNPKAKPQIKWKITSASGGWTKLNVSVNCPGRVSGRLWIKSAQGYMQRLPRFTGENLICHVPFDCANAELVCTSGTDIAIFKS